MFKMVAHLPPLVLVKETEFSSMEGGVYLSSHLSKGCWATALLVGDGDGGEGTLPSVGF